jgi:thiol-disulfide isomerase/thioredoxin
MPDEPRSIQDPMDIAAGVPDPSRVEAPTAGQTGGLGQRQKAWLGMAAVLVALALLTLMPTGSVDPNAPPPAADPSSAPLSGADSGLSAVGMDAPLHFAMKDVNGVDVKLASFKGKVILVNFWATWCGPCKVEIPDLIELQREYPDQLVVIGIDVLDEWSRVKPFADTLKVNYPLLDANNRKDVEDAFGPMWGLPTTVVVGRDGKVAKRHSGIATKEQFKQYVDSLL